MEGALKLKADFNEACLAGIGEGQLEQVRTLFKAAGEAIASNQDFMENVLRPLLGPAVSELAGKQAAEPTDEEGG
jgi:hypothetical protein